MDQKEIESNERNNEKNSPGIHYSNRQKPVTLKDNAISEKIYQLFFRW